MVEILRDVWFMGTLRQKHDDKAECNSPSCTIDVAIKQVSLIDLTIARTILMQTRNSSGESRARIGLFFRPCKARRNRPVMHIFARTGMTTDDANAKIAGLAPSLMAISNGVFVWGT
ncbi:hypothetical protein HCU01_08420 [Halomonas cupida]|uniref:Uncharacterized protein n=1 Tax=Halomonas cupida TaxID=44933 RepID=A0ABQ0WCE5_9GAMM|nr:hypothetical protein HCU01_08420 [Halomonas cupida]